MLRDCFRQCLPSPSTMKYVTLLLATNTRRRLKGGFHPPQTQHYLDVWTLLYHSRLGTHILIFETSASCIALFNIYSSRLINVNRNSFLAMELRLVWLSWKITYCAGAVTTQQPRYCMSPSRTRSATNSDQHKFYNLHSESGWPEMRSVGLYSLYRLVHYGTSF